MSHGKVTRCLESLFGIRLSRGGSVHTVLRAARRCEPVYEAIRKTVARDDPFTFLIHALVGAVRFFLPPPLWGRVGVGGEIAVYPPPQPSPTRGRENRTKSTGSCMSQPGLDATNWRAELAIRFGVILRKVWGGSRTWVGARAQSVLMSVWRTCWQQGRSALDFLSQRLRGMPDALPLPP